MLTAIVAGGMNRSNRANPFIVVLTLLSVSGFVAFGLPPALAGAGAGVDVMVATNIDEHGVFLVSGGAFGHVTDEVLAGAVAAYGLPVEAALTPCTPPGLPLPPTVTAVGRSTISTGERPCASIRHRRS